MKERTKTIGATRLLWSLVLGLGLALGLLWAVMPHSAVGAQAVSSDLIVDSPKTSIWDQVSHNDDDDIVAPVARTAADAAPASAPAPVPPRDVRTPPDFAFLPEASRATGGVPMFAPVGTSAGDVADVHPLNASLLTPPLPGSADLVICMTTDRVWGIVGAGETVTVTVDGAQMGATLADGNGFFWTTLYDSSGDRPNLGGGEAVVVYHDSVQEASVTLRSITGTIDVVSDVVSGTIGGVTSPISVTLYAPGDEPSMISYSQTVSADGSGNFTADFMSISDIVADDPVVVAYVENGVEVHQHIYANRIVVLPFPFNSVNGWITPGTVVTATVYSDATTIRDQVFGTADVNTGRYELSPDFQEGDTVVVELANGMVMSRTVDHLTHNVDPANDHITGTALSGAIVRGIVYTLTPLGWHRVQVSATVDAGGVYTIEFSGIADIMPGQWAGAHIADDEGDDLALWGPSPSVEVNQTWNEVSGVGPSDPGPDSDGRVVTLTLASTTTAYTAEMNWWSWYNFNQGDHGLPEVEPGEIVTVEAEGYAWRGVVEVMTMTVQHDLDADRFTGTVETPTDRVELSGWNWQSYLYPLAGSFNMLVTATSPFVATPPGFDVRNWLNYDVAHRTADDYLERISHETNGFGVLMSRNVVVGTLAPPGTAYTITLYDSGMSFKGRLTGTSYGPIGRIEWNNFWDVGQRIEAGDRVQVQSGAGFSQTLVVPTLTISQDTDTDVINGQGPANVLLYLSIKPQGEGFVPTDEGGQFAVTVDQLQEAWGDGDLRWGDEVDVRYHDENWNFVEHWFGWPQIIAHYEMDGRNDVWGENAIPGNIIYVTVTHPVSGVIATGMTTAGTAPWAGPNGYQLQLPNGTIVPSNTVTVNWGDGFVDSTVVVTITANPDVDTDIVTGTAPANGWLHANAEHAWGDWIDISDIQVDASGVYTIDFGGEGWDIQYGDRFNIHYSADHGHQTQYSFWVPAPELSIDKWNVPGHARPDGVVVYGIDYWNNGNGVATDTLVVDTLPANTSWAGDTSGVMPDIGAGGVITWNLGNLEAGDRRGFIVTLDVFGLSDGDTIDQNCVVITTTTPGDYDLGNNGPRCAGTVDVWDDEVDIGVDKRPSPGDPTPGQEFTYNINTCNNRGAAAGPVLLTDTLPLSTTFVSWSSDFGDTTYWTEVVTTGGQVVLYAPGLPGDMCEDLRLRLLLDPDVPVSTTLENTIVITTAGDVDPGNDERVSTDAHISGPRYDMNANKWYNNGVLVPGGWIRYGANYWNAGNTAIQAWMTDTLPPGTSYQPGSGQDHDGEPFAPVQVTVNYVVWDLGVVPVNDGFGFDFTLDISDTLSTPADLGNCVTVGITETEETPWDNTACVTETVYAPGPNLYVTKEKRDYGPGNDMINYRIYFGNRGDQTIYDAVITDTLPISTTYDRHNVNWEGSQYTDTASATELVVVFERIEAGWSGEIDLDVRLDDPNARLRWYTNTVEITTPPSDADPTDNVYTDVAFSGGEVDQVDLGVYGNNLWGCAYSPPVTITTAYTEMVLGWECWDEWFEDPFMPGHVVTVAAGAGTHPVVIEIPDPFDATADSSSDMVWGQIDALDHEWVEVDLDRGPTKNVQTDGSGNFSATFPDIPRGGQGEVRYRTEIDYADVTFHRRFQTLDLVLNVDYYNNDLYGNYEAGHTVWLTVTESDTSTVKARAQVETGPIPEWGGQSGFQPREEDWMPRRPDIEPGDWVFGLVDNGQATQVHIGTITGTVDVDNDSISGRIYAPWFTEILHVECHEWAGVGAPGKESTAGPDGDPPYDCAWDPATEWDVQPGEDIGVWYRGSDLNLVGAGFREPQPYVTINKGGNGNPAEGGNFAFNIGYWNGSDDRDYAANVVITDTLLGGMTYLTDTSGFPHTGTGAPGDPLVWDLGTVPGNRGDNFDVFVQVTAVENDIITNTVEISTSSPYNQSSPGERYAEWSGTVQANDTHLGVDKYLRGADPAPDTDFTWAVNVCNWGSTASSEVTLTDTLPISTSLLGWQGQNPGWTEVLNTSDQLVVSYPSLADGWCSEVYLRFHLDKDAWINMPISNTVEISAANDLEGGSVFTDWRWVSGPYSNLYVRQGWLYGVLVPGGGLSYEMEYGNDGNAPADGVFITYTLPASTTFRNAWWWDQHDQYPFVPTAVTGDYVVWDLGTLENGFSRHFGVSLQMDEDASPGTVLTSGFEITPHPSDYHHDDNAITWVETLNDDGPNLEVHKQNYWWNGNNQIQYEMRVKNRGSERLEPVWITDTYPISTTWDPGWWWVGHGPWITVTHDAPNRQIVLWVQSLDPGETANIQFWVELDGPIHGTQGLLFTNTLSAPIPGDVYPADNTDEVVAYAGPDVYAEKWLRAGEPRPGKVVTFTVKFGNRNSWGGMDDMWGSHLTDTLPAEMTFITATVPWDPNQRWVPDEITGTTSVRWGWGTPWPDSAWYFHLVARITDTVQSGDVITNIVEFGDDNPSNVDLSPNNDVFELGVTILDPVFEVGKVYESNRVAGMPVTYTLTVTNTGNYPGSNVVLSDTIPAYLEDVSTDGTFQLDWVWWLLGPIAPDGGTDTAQFSATLPCTVGLSIVNDDYGVRGSDQGVSSPAGAPVSFSVVAPTLSPTFTQSATLIDADTTVTFTDTSTTDGTDIVAWAWDFGDTGVGSGKVVTHTYSGTGAFTVTLTITDACGISKSGAVPSAVTIARTHVYLPLVMRNH